MRAMWGSLWLGWLLYAFGLVTVLVFSEMTRSFELFIAVYAGIGLVLVSHRIAVGSRVVLPFRGGVMPIDVALFAFLWPVLASVALMVLSVANVSRQPVA